MISQRLEPYWLIGLALAAALAIVQTAEHLADAETVPNLKEKIRKQPESAPLRERLGHAYIRDGSPAEAIPHLQFAIARMPANVTAPLALGKVYVAEKRPTDAQEVLDACLKHHPEDAGCNELLADLLIQSLGEDAAMATATRLYTVANRNDPTLPHAGLAMSKAAAARGDLNTSLNLLEKPLKAHPRDPALLLQAARVFTQAAAASKSESTAQHVAIVKMYNLAQQYFDRGTVLDPKNVQAFIDYGAMLVDANRAGAAETVLRQALELSPKNAQAKMHLGRALRELAFENRGERAKAVDAFKEAVTLDPRNARTYYEWAVIYIKSNEEAYAINFLKDAVKFDDQYVDAWRALASLQMYAKDASLRDPAEGLSSLKDAVVSSGWKDLGLIIAFGRAQIRAQQYDTAVDTFDRALKLDMDPKIREIVGSYRQDALLKTFPPEDPTSGIDIELLLPRNPLDTTPAWPSLRRGAVPANVFAEPIPITTKPALDPEAHP